MNITKPSIASMMMSKKLNIQAFLAAPCSAAFISSISESEFLIESKFCTKFSQMTVSNCWLIENKLLSNRNKYAEIVVIS
jgi:hypothetical protein